MWFKDIRKETRIIMEFYRKAIEDLEVEECEKVDEAIEDMMTKIPRYQPIYYYDVPCYFVEVIPKEKQFRISFDGESYQDFDYCEVYNVSDR